MSKRKKIAIYVRKSRLKDSDSMEIERQIELLIEYAEKNNMEYVIFHEEGSSEDWNRPKLQEMMKFLERENYDGILVTDQDRISRDSTDMGLFKRFCKKESLLLYTLTKTYNYLNDEDDFISGIQAEMDSQFMRVTKRKMMRGRIQALERGVYFGVAPYGYTKDYASKHKNLIIDPVESEVVKMIFDLYVNKKMNQSQIVDRINLMGILTRENKKWTVRKTSFILSNVAYMGRLLYELDGHDPIDVRDAHEAIVDEETFNKAQIILSERRIVPQKSRISKHTLSRLLKCPKCNTTLSFSHSFKSSTRREKGKALYILNCWASASSIRKKENPELRNCGSYGCRSEIVEKLILEDVKRYINQLEDEIKELRKDASAIVDDLNNNIERINKRLKEVENERKRIQDGYKKGIYDDAEAQEALKENKEIKLKLQMEKDKLEGSDASTEIDRKNKLKEKAVRIIEEETDVATLNSLLRDIIDVVYYYKEKPDNSYHKYQPDLHIRYKS